jgi:hypothetical protein
MAIAIERNFPIPRQAVVQELDQPEVAVDGLDKSAKIEKDLVDRVRESYEDTIKTGMATLLFVGGEVAILAFKDPSFIPLGLPVVYFAAKGLKGGLIEEAKIEKHSILNKLGYRADPFVYRGEKLQIGHDTLEDGDNCYRLRLPEVSGENNELSPEQKVAIADLYAQCLSDFSIKTAQRDYRIVFVELGSDFAKQSPLFKNVPQITKGELLEGKNITVTSSDMPVAVMSREALDAMTLEQSEIFERAVNALEESIGRKIDGKLLTQELKRLKFKKGEDLLTEARRLSIKLDHLVVSEGERQFNGVLDTFIDRTPEDEDCKYVLRKRLGQHPVLTVAKSLKGESLQQIKYERGDKRTLLKLDRDLDDIIAMTIDAKERVLLLSYRISQMLKSSEFLAEIAKEPSFGRDKVLERLQELGLKIKYPPNDEISPRHRLATALRSALLAAAVSGILIAGGRIAVEVGSEMSAAPTQQEGIGQTQSPQEYRPVFGDIKSDLTWRVEDNTKQESNLKANGYYILSTANVYKNGEWITNNDLKTAALLDNAELVKANDQSSSITITGDIILDGAGKANFKLPIRDHSTLYRLAIVDTKGNNISEDAYKVYKLEDGTFEVDISFGSAKASTFVQIKEVLVWSQDSVHATKPIPAINTNRLNKDALELLNANQGTQQQLALAVSQGVFSMDPANKSILDNLDGSPESFVNAADKLDGKSCIVANTEFALLSRRDPQDYVNIAFGYGGAIINTKNKSHLYIDNISSHAFTLTNSGEIIDATPSLKAVLKAAQDDGTKKATNEGTDLDTLWNQKENELKKQAEKAVAEEEARRNQMAVNLEAMLVLGAIGSGLVLAPKGIGTVRRSLSQEKIGSLLPGKLDLGKLSLEELQEIYNFFTLLCFGGRKSLAPASSVPSFQTRSEFLERAKLNLTKGPLEEYLSNPEVFEKVFGITDSKTCRRLARLFLSE